MLDLALMNKLIVLALILSLSAWVYYRNVYGRTIGLVHGHLHPCPGSPNCVGSLDNDPVHHVDPFPILNPNAPLEPLKKLLKELPRVSIVVDKPHYLHAECRSRLMRFVDDLEFAVDTDQQIIHVRSASRLGYGDFGVNRRRVEELRQRYLESPPH